MPNPTLLNPHGTASREDLVKMMDIIANVLTGRPQDCWQMTPDLINHLNSTQKISPKG